MRCRDEISENNGKTFLTIIATMISALLKLSCLFGWILLGFTKDRKAVAAYPLFVISAIIAFMYLMGLIGLLYYSYLLVFWGGILAIPISIIAMASNHKFSRSLLAPGPIVLAIVILAYVVYAQGVSIVSYDEFGFWGLVPKEMIFLNALRDASSSLGYDDYPPATAVLQYFMGKGSIDPTPEFYLAQIILLVSSVSAIFITISWKQIIYIPLYLFAIYYGVSNLGKGFASLYADHIIAVYFSGIIATYLLCELRGWRILLLGPPLFVLVLIKKVGIFFSGITLMIILADVTIKYLIGRINYHNYLSFKIRKLKYCVNIFRKISPYMLLAVIPLISHYSWEARVTGLELKKTFQDMPGVGDIRLVISDKPQEKHVKCWNNYWKYLYEGRVGNSFQSDESIISNIGLDRGLSVIGWTIVISIVFLIGWLMSDIKHYSLSFLLTIWSGGLMYYLGLYLSYIYLFSEYESNKLASVGRYSQSYLLGIWVIAVCYYHPAIRCGKNINSTVRMGVYIILLILISLFEPIQWNVQQGDGGRAAKNIVEEIDVLMDEQNKFIQALKNNLKPDNKIYVLFQNTNGFAHRVIRYYLYPLTVNRWGWSIAPPYKNSEQYTVNFSLKEISRNLREYDYLYIGKTNRELTQYYGSLFENQDENHLGIYKIYPQMDSGDVLLRRAEICP